MIMVAQAITAKVPSSYNTFSSSLAE